MKAIFLITATFSVGVALAGLLIYLYINNLDKIMNFINSKF